MNASKAITSTTMTTAPTTTATSTTNSTTTALTPRRKQRNATKTTTTTTTTVITTTSSADEMDYTPLQHYDDHNHASDNLSVESWDPADPPFLPLEEDISLSSSHHHQQKDLLSRVCRYYRHYRQSLLQQPWTTHYENCRKSCSNISGKQFVSITMIAIIIIIMLDALLSDPEDRLFFQPDFSVQFLQWVQYHPTSGILAFLLLIAVAVVLLIPIGTPLTCGCGYIYVRAYGWTTGMILATVVAMGGSALGAVTCFLLGRYLMREQVRKWSRKYPLFDAIDVAAAEHGLRIMAMLYLTPILPLGPVSYMCGTTSMALSNFILAKIASLPLMLLYVFIGASTGALLLDNNHQNHQQGDGFKEIEDNQVLIVSGIILSFVMIASITNYIKKELNKILDRQKKHKPGELENNDKDKSNDNYSNINSNTTTIDAFEEAAMEMGASSKMAPRHRRTAVE